MRKKLFLIFVGMVPSGAMAQQQTVYYYKTCSNGVCSYQPITLVQKSRQMIQKKPLRDTGLSPKLQINAEKTILRDTGLGGN
jgi:hypothetical protein